MAGRLIDNGNATVTTAITVSPNLRNTGLNGDPKVEGFVDTASNLRIAVTDYDGVNQRPVYVYDAPTGGQVSQVTWPVINLYNAVRLGGYLYAIDYDTATVIEVYADPAATSPSYQATGVTYTLDPSFNPDPTTYQAVGQELIVVNNVLYGLFAFPDTSWSSYADSLIVSFDIDPGNSIDVDASNDTLAGNAFAVATNGSDLFVAALGGPQTTSGYNTSSRIQSLPADLSTVTPRMQPSPTFPYEFRDISFKGNLAYVFAGAYQLDPTDPSKPWQMNGALFSTTNFAARTTIDTVSAVPGYFWSEQYTSDTDRIWYAHGNDVWVYNASTLATPAQIPIATLAGGGRYDSLNDLAYVGAVTTGTRSSLRGYRSHWQRSNSPLAVAVRAITQGRPEATEEEIAQAKASLAK
jgi:hypothetical protein